MTEKDSRPGPVPQVLPEHAPALSNVLSDLGREQFAIAIETACTWLRSRDSMRQLQQEVAHQALVTHEAAAEKLRDTNGPADLLSVQLDLTRFYLEGPGQYWQQVARTGLHTHIEMMARVNHMFIGKTGDSFRWALNNFQAALAYKR